MEFCVNNFYVYQYLREDGTPYYIGKGKDTRAWDKHSNIQLPSDISRISLIRDNLDENVAHELEIKLIAEYGRKDLGTGILHNKTNGGEGTSGTLVSDETRAKMSAARRGKKLSEETRAKMSAVRKGRSNGKEGTKHSVETIEKMRSTHNKNYESQELRDKIAISVTKVWEERKSKVYITSVSA